MAGTSDCITSLSRWEKLSARRTGTAIWWVMALLDIATAGEDCCIVGRNVPKNEHRPMPNRPASGWPPGRARCRQTPFGLPWQSRELQPSQAGRNAEGARAIPAETHGLTHDATAGRMPGSLISMGQY